MNMQVVKGGGFELLTADPVLIAVVRRCAELERENICLRHLEVARFRTLRRDVRQIRRAQIKARDEALKGPAA